MDIIQAFIKKHNGRHHQESKKSIHTPTGKYSSQLKRGVVIYKGNKLSVSINEVSDADPVSELFKMKLINNVPLNVQLLIFPRSYWSIMFRSMFRVKIDLPNKMIQRQYKFSGSKRLKKKLLGNVAFLELLIDQHLCVNISNNLSKTIVITPSHGYKSVEHLEQLAEILTIVKSCI